MTILRLCVFACLVAAAAPVGAGDTGSAPERDFDFWIGEWTVHNRQRNPTADDDPRLFDTGTAQLRVYPVVGGHAIVEHWDGALSWGHVRGFSVRAWDPDAGEWLLVLNWPLPHQPVPVFSTLRGRFRHGRGEFFSEGTRPDGTPRLTRYTFSDAAPDRFRWDSATSSDQGLHWATGWIMEGTRRGPDQPALLHGPRLALGAPALCDSAEARALDGLAGLWTGEARSTGAADATPVRLGSYAILDGCAVMDRTELAGAGGKNWERFAVRALDPERHVWVQWALDSSRAVLRRSEGRLEAGRLVLESDPADGPGERETWTGLDGDAPHWRLERDSGAGLEAVWEATLAR